MSKNDLKMKSNVSKAAVNLEKMVPIAEKEDAAMVNGSLAKTCQLVVPITPVKSGGLRRGYQIIETRKLSSDHIVRALVNNEKCFRYVNDDHRTKDGGFIRGRFILQESSKLVNATYISKRSKQMATTIVKKG